MRTLNFYDAHIARVVTALAGVVAVSVFLYGALLLGAVSHAAGRTAAESAVRALSARVGALEGEFLSKTKALSPERAAALGYVAPSSVATVYAEAPALVLR